MRHYYGMVAHTKPQISSRYCFFFFNVPSRQSSHRRAFTYLVISPTRVRCKYSYVSLRLQTNECQQRRKKEGENGYLMDASSSSFLYFTLLTRLIACKPLELSPTIAENIVSFLPPSFFPFPLADSAARTLEMKQASTQSNDDSQFSYIQYVQTALQKENCQSIRKVVCTWYVVYTSAQLVSVVPTSFLPLILRAPRSPTGELFLACLSLSFSGRGRTERKKEQR